VEAAHRLLADELGVTRLRAIFDAGNYTTTPVKGMTAWADHWTSWIFRRSGGLISQARTWQRTTWATRPVLAATTSGLFAPFGVPVLYVPSESDLYFPVADARRQRLHQQEHP